MTHPTHEEYQLSSSVTLLDAPFYSLLCALFRQADSDNLALLEDAFPETLHTFKKRVNAPGGLLPGETGIIDGTTYHRSSEDDSVKEVENAS